MATSSSTAPSPIPPLVGLEAISFAIPDRFIELKELAEARGVDPKKFTQGLGQVEMAVACPSEDTVALAAEAGLKLLERWHIDPQTIGMLIVGTETSVDQSKAVSSYVHEFLGLSPHCRSYETKQACYGAMAGLQAATDWVLSGRARGKKALIIASDIARYGLKTAGEPTQGAGAVALLISENPQLLEFDTSRQGYFTEQVMDFWRPAYSKEAFADGHYSIECYLRALRSSFEMYAGAATDKLTLFDSFGACLYHAPFAKMMQKAHVALRADVSGLQLEPKTPAHETALADYALRVGPYLELNARVGNIYTGSLFLALIPLLESGSVAPGEAVSLFSYGSGCTAEFLSGRVGKNAAELMRRFPFRADLAHRNKISLEEYERLTLAAAKADHDGSATEALRWPTQLRVKFTGVEGHQRLYDQENESVARIPSPSLVSRN